MFLKDTNNFTVTKADTLTTARTINGTSFNGSANITTANWGTARNLTIGNTAKSVNGSGNVSWTLSEIGAAAASHTHSYLPLSGGSVTGRVNVGGRCILPPVYNYDKGTLINICAAANQTMVTIHVTGNSYGAGLPINSMYHFYDYTQDGGILSASGVHNGYNIGNMTVYRNNGRLYAWIKQPASYQTFNIEIIANKTLDASISNAAVHTSGNTNTITITPSVASMNGHTHNYAGSSSAGGAANSANTLATARTINGTSFNGSANITTANWGTARNIYIADNSATNTGPAVSVNGSANATLKLPATIKATTFTGALSGNATTATTLATARTINGTSFNGSANITTANWGTARNITIGNTTKSVNGSGNVAWSLSEIGAAASSHTHNYAGSSSAGGNANAAITLYNSKGRVASANIATVGDNKLSYILATSAMTTGKPAEDGKIIHMEWDNTGGYSSQLFLGHGASPKLQIRGMNGGTWGSWITAYTTANPQTTITGNAGTATTLQTARTINGTSFNGSANITTANWGTARNIYIADNSATNTGPAVSVNGSANATLKLPATIKAALTGNATTATTLATARTINGTSFNGSANITTANWGTARTIKIGNTGKSVNGSANITWTLAEIGAAASSHTHNNIVSRGSVTAESGVAGRPAVSGLSMSEVYSNGYPTPYGNVISLRGMGDGQILVGWSGTDGAHAPVYVRSKRDNTSTANWSDWAQVYTTANKPTISDIGALGAKHANGYLGMTTLDRNDIDWIRTTSSGIIPYSSNTAGTSSLGTATWPFANIYTRALATPKIQAYSMFDAANDNANHSGFAVHFKGTDALFGAYDYTGLQLYFDTFLGYTGLEIKHPSDAVEIWGSYYHGTTYVGSSTARFAGILPYGHRNNTYSLGDSSYRWSDVYCTRGAFNGSDKSLKEDIKKISSSQTRENSSDYVTSEDLYNHVKNSSTYTFKYRGTDNHVMGVIANEIPDNIFNLLGKMSKTEEEYQQEKELEDNPKIKERYEVLKEYGEYDKKGKEDRIDRKTGLTYAEIKSIAEGNYTPEAPVRLLNPASQVAMLQEVLSMSLNKIEQLEERIKVLENN